MKIGHVYNVYPLKMKKGSRTDMFVIDEFVPIYNCGLTLTVILRDIIQSKILYYFLPVVLVNSSCFSFFFLCEKKKTKLCLLI